MQNVKLLINTYSSSIFSWVTRETFRALDKEKSWENKYETVSIKNNDWMIIVHVDTYLNFWQYSLIFQFIYYMYVFDHHTLKTL